MATSFFRASLLLLALPTISGFATTPLAITRTFPQRPPITRTFPQRAASPRLALAEERTESAKAGVIAAVCGSVCSAPAALVSTIAFTPQWEFATDALALQLALFGVVYRYAVRTDKNEQLQQGAVGAFALVRTLSSVQVGSQCSALPLNCGPPIGYLDWDMLLQLGAYFGESALAFGGAAFALEFAWSKGWAKRLPAEGLPAEE